MIIKANLWLFRLLVITILGLGVCLLVNEAQAQQVPYVPAIASGLIGKSTDICSLVTVHALTKFQNKSFYQSGIGWIVESANGQIEVITPAHVVADSTQIFIQCDNFITAAEVSGQSSNMDLAILREQGTDFKSLQKTFKLAPLVVMKDRTKYAIPKGSEYITEAVFPDHTFLMNKSWLTHSKKNRWAYPYIFAGYESLENKLIEANQTVFDLSPTPGFASQKNFSPYGAFDLLAIEALAIHPGLSGVPLLVAPFEGSNAPSRIAFNDGNYIAGMIVRTDQIGMRSLAISIDDVIAGYFSIKNTVSSNANYPAVSYAYSNIADKLIRHPVIVQEKGDGSDLVAYDLCDNSYQESSSWVGANSAVDYFGKKTEEVVLSELLKKTIKNNSGSIAPSPKSFKIPSGDAVKLGGGDYGESGGGEFIATDRTRFNVFADGGARQHGYISAYKTTKFCKQSGLKILEGKILTGYIDRNGLGHKLTDINDLNYEIGKGSIQQRAAKVEEILAGASSTENIDPSIVCRSPIFAKQSVKFIEGISRSVVGFREVVVKSVGALSSSLSDSYIACDKDFKTLSINLDQQKLRFGRDLISKGQGLHFLSLPKFKLNLQFKSAKEIKGGLVVGSKCRIDLSDKNLIVANPWKIQINDSYVKAELNLDSKDRLLRFNVISVDKKCLDGQQMQPWLDEFSVYEVSQ